jgi:hypothetical protein
LIRATLEHVLTTNASASVPAALLSHGWLDIFDASPRSALAALFEVQGHAQIASPAMDLVALHALGLPVEAELAVVHPLIEARDQFGTGSDQGGVVAFRGVLLSGCERASAFVVPLVDDGHPTIAVMDAVEAESSAIGGFDPALQLTRVEGAARPREVVPGPEAARYVSVCQWALAHELLGVADRLYDLTVEHVTQREQFGAPLGVLQSVKHRVAEIVVAISGTRAVLGALDQAPSVFVSRVAKASAGRAALLAARHAQQLAGAIGFTEEHPLPGVLRRTHLLDALFGSSSWLQGQIGMDLLATADMPRLFTIGAK